MEQNENDIHRQGGMRNSRVWSGLILVAAGVLYLAHEMHGPIPDWLFTWPVLLITIGLLIGIKSRFHNPGAFIMIIVGSVFLIDRISPELNFHNYIGPAILIGIGLIFILRPRHNWSGKSKRDWHRMHKIPDSPFANKGYVNPSPADQAPENYPPIKNNPAEDNAEYVEINTAFGSVKKIILSKNFKGGEINNFMGGTEINLMKADIQNPIALEINNVFGGAKLIVPSNWDVKNEVTAVFGGIEDKRTLNSGITDPEKVMVLKGTCVFGGIEITNY
jgi:predicted membrane protein